MRRCCSGTPVTRSWPTCATVCSRRWTAISGFATGSWPRRRDCSTGRPSACLIASWRWDFCLILAPAGCLSVYRLGQAREDQAVREVPAEVREVLRDYLPQVTKLFGTTLEAVILYGSAAGGDYLPGRSNTNLLTLLSRPEGALLQKSATLHRRWQKDRTVVPACRTPPELRSSL